MRTKIEVDRRAEIDKKYDKMYEKMVKAACLSPKQKAVVSAYLRAIIQEKIQEVENAMDMSYWIGLIELYKFGCNKRATRLPRLQKYVKEIVNEAYGHSCVDANGMVIDYDGCGLSWLKCKLRRYGIEIEDRTEVTNK